MNDQDAALAAVRVLASTAATGSMDARIVALRVLDDFVRYHKPAAQQNGQFNMANATFNGASANLKAMALQAQAREVSDRYSQGVGGQL